MLLWILSSRCSLPRRQSVLRLFVSSFEATRGLLHPGQLRESPTAICARSALLNSVLYGVAVTVVAIVFAVPIAWAVRAPTCRKSFVRAIILGPSFTPSISAPSADPACRAECRLAHRIWMTLTGSETGSATSTASAASSHHRALQLSLYLRLRQRRARPRLDRDGGGASILGAGALRRYSDYPAAGDAGDHRPAPSSPSRRGRLVRHAGDHRAAGAHHVMTLQLWQYFEFPVRAEAASAYAIPLILITCFLFWLQRASSAARAMSR